MHMAATTRTMSANGGLDLSHIKTLPDNLSGQRVVILITLVAALPRIPYEAFREALGWTPTEMEQVLQDFGSIASQLDLVS